MGSLGGSWWGYSTYHLPEEPRLLHAWRLILRLALLAVALFFLLMFLSQQAHASDGAPDAAASQASASTDPTPPRGAGACPNKGETPNAPPRFPGEIPPPAVSARAGPPSGGATAAS